MNINGRMPRVFKKVQKFMQSLFLYSILYVYEELLISVNMKKGLTVVTWNKWNEMINGWSMQGRPKNGSKCPN